MDTSPSFNPIVHLLILSPFRARGVDYPGVTKVIQVGAPGSRDLYIHRIGRTGRAGADGSAVLILAPFEKNFLNELNEIPIKNHELPESELETGPREDKVLEQAKDLPPAGMVEETFMSLLGYCMAPPHRSFDFVLFTANG
jgi:superfamily II DNA/RNA helicase